MFQSLVAHMQDSMHLVSNDYFPEKLVAVPTRLLSPKPKQKLRFGVETQ
jgi:hypothetical protein